MEIMHFDMPRMSLFENQRRRNYKKYCFSGTGSTFCGGQFAKVAPPYARSKKIGGVKVANPESLVLAVEGTKKSIFLK